MPFLLSDPTPANPVFPRRRVRIVVVKPAGYVHAEAFRELAESLAQGFRQLGIAAEVADNRFDPAVTNLVLGWHLLDPPQLDRLPASTVLYNLEQMDERNRELRERLLALCRYSRVWDYSERNIDILRAAGCRTQVRHVPIGYAPVLTRIPPAAKEDIDILFYGSVNDRRAAVLQRLQAAGVKVCAVFGVYGPARDALIARAKVVLNLHYYGSSILELVRVSYLLANHKAVVAECHGATEVDEDLRDAMVLVPYEGLVDACLELLQDPERRRAIGERGFQRISARSLAEILRPVLTELPPSQHGRGGDGSTAFLFEPDGSRDDWSTVLDAYLNAYAPGDPVVLLLWMDPAKKGQVPRAEVRERILERLAQAGKSTFADLVLVDKPAELLESLRNCQRAYWIRPGTGLSLPLGDPSGKRFADKIEQLRSQI